MLYTFIQNHRKQSLIATLNVRESLLNKTVTLGQITKTKLTNEMV